MESHGHGEARKGHDGDQRASVPSLEELPAQEQSGKQWQFPPRLAGRGGGGEFLLQKVQDAAIGKE